MGKKMNQKEEESQKIVPCTICLIRKPNAILNCSHSFCYRCIRKWSNRRQTCPICRDQIVLIESGRRRIQLPSQAPRVTSISTSYTFRPILMVPCFFYNYGWNYYMMNQFMYPIQLPTSNLQ